MNIWKKLFGKRPSSYEIEHAERSLRRSEDVSRKLKRDERMLLKLEAEIDRKFKEINNLAQKWKVIVETTGEDLHEGRLANEQCQRSMELLQAAKDVAENVTIPRLATQLKEVQAASEANIALSNHRRAMASPVRSDGEL